MFRTSLQHLTRRIATTIAHYRRGSRGVAAIEFAMIVPIMSAMFIGAVEVSQAITVDRRVTQVASSTADQRDEERWRGNRQRRAATARSQMRVLLSSAPAPA